MTFPDSSARRCVLAVTMSFTKTSVLLTSSSETSQFTMFHCWCTDPVDARIVSDCGVRWIDYDNFKKFISGILVNPVRRKNSKVSSTATNSLFSNRSQTSLEFKLSNTLVDWFTVSDTLWSNSFTGTSANTNTVDNIALFSFVSKTSCFVWASWVLNTVDNRKLTIFPASNSE